MIESLLPRLPVKAIQYTSESQEVYTCSYIPPAQVLISALSRPGILSQLLDANVPADLVATEIVHGRVARTHPYFAADQVAVKDEEEVAASGADHDKVSLFFFCNIFIYFVNCFCNHASGPINFRVSQFHFSKMFVRFCAASRWVKPLACARKMDPLVYSGSSRTFSAVPPHRKCSPFASC